MDAKVKKFAAAAVAGVIMAGSLGVATPAAAGGYGWGHGGGWGHGPGWGHGGGWGRGGWGGPGWAYRHGGWGGPRWGYRGGGWGYRGGWGAPVAAGLIGGLALGAAAAASHPYYGGYYSRACYPADQPVYDDWGNFLGYRRVRVCN